MTQEHPLLQQLRGCDAEGASVAAWQPEAHALEALHRGSDRVALPTTGAAAGLVGQQHAPVGLALEVEE